MTDEEIADAVTLVVGCLVAGAYIFIAIVLFVLAVALWSL